MQEFDEEHISSNEVTYCTASYYNASLYMLHWNFSAILKLIGKGNWLSSRPCAHLTCTVLKDNIHFTLTFLSIFTWVLNIVILLDYIWDLHLYNIMHSYQFDTVSVQLPHHKCYNQHSEQNDDEKSQYWYYHSWQDNAAVVRIIWWLCCMINGRKVTCLHSCTHGDQSCTITD